MKTIVAVPCTGVVPTEFMVNLLQLKKSENIDFVVTIDSLVYVARNNIAKAAIEKNADRILWLDSDVICPTDTLIRLSKHMDDGLDYVSGIYFTRQFPVEPLLYSAVNGEKTENGYHFSAEKLYDYGETLSECAGTGFGCVMTTVSLLKKVTDKFGSPFMPIANLGEDLSFCWRCSQLGEKLYYDPSIKCGHVGRIIFSEEHYKEQIKMRD